MSRFLLSWFLLLIPAALAAQGHEGHGQPARQDTMRMPAHADTMSATMMMPGPLGIPQTREGSGTSWLPDRSPMYAHHAQAGGWEFMLHDNVFVQYLDDGSDRGRSQFGSINWVMGMARRAMAGGELGLRAMMSLEPLTVGKCGYPDLLATGEFCNGQPIVDRQHPHDLFMELSAQYQRQLTPGLGLQLYGGPVAEPALGPTAFPHRVSAMWNPVAPISHHWMDATHISFGAVTAGLYGRQWKAEASVFNGREPDEDRYDLDLGPLDSYSGRIWWLPTDRWAFQVSAGRINDAEPAHGGEGEAEDITRTTASATYHRPIGTQGLWANTFVWGRNHPAEGRTSDAFLLESALNLDDRNILFGRADFTWKSAEEFALPIESEELFAAHKFTLGYVRQLGSFVRIIPAVGASVSLSVLSDDLEPFYGSTTPLSTAIYIQFHPAQMQMGAMHDMHGMPRMNSQ